MAIPILPFIAGGILSASFDSIMSPPKRSARQHVNRKFPNEIPDLGSIIRAYNQGFIGDSIARWGTRGHGSSLLYTKDASYDPFTELWQGVSQSLLSVPSPGEVIQAKQQGLLSQEAFDLLLKRSGGHEALFSLLTPYYLSWMDTNSLMVARNRGLITDRGFYLGIKRQGLHHDGLDWLYNKLREQLPGPGEFTGHAARGALDMPYATSAGLYSEMPPSLETMFNVHGLHGVSDGIPSHDLGLNGATWAQVAWAGHWSTLGLGFINEAYHRLRPGREARFAADGLLPPAYLRADIDTLLRVNGVSSGHRDAVLAMGFRPLDRRILLQGMTTGEVNRTEAIEIMRDGGTSKADSERFADIMQSRIDYTNFAPVRAIEHSAIGRTFRSAERAYRVGSMDRVAFVASQTGIGVSEEAANANADSVDADLQTDRVAAILKAIRRDYLSGAMPPQELQTLLTISGLPQSRVTYYTTLWQSLRTLERRTAATEKILAWYVAGILTQDVAYARLSNLGWTAVDALAYIAEASLKIAKRDAAIQQANLRNAKQNAAMIDRILKQAKKQVTDLQNELKRLTPVGRLIKWARQGSISEAVFESRLDLMGYPKETIALYWQEVLKDGSLPAAKKSGPSPASATVGTTAVSTVPSDGGPPQGQPQQVTLPPISETGG